MNAAQIPTLTSSIYNCLPSEGCRLFQAINTWAIIRGYAIITGRSTKKKVGRLAITDK